jgi:acyl-CoA reductase-like NAD-dependent aldehyde dehydrogenase
MNAQPTGSHFINGAYVDDAGGQKFDVVYGATGEAIATLRAATPAIVESAVAAAQIAQPAWAALKPIERGRVLQRAAAILRERNEALARLETLNTGRAIQETLVADAASAADALEFSATRSAASTATISISAAPSPTRAASAWRSASASAPGTIRSRAPAGRRRRRSPWATPWCSSLPRLHR